MQTVNPFSRVNPSHEKGYPARRADRVERFCCVNAYRRLPEEGLPISVIPIGLATTWGHA